MPLVLIGLLIGLLAAPVALGTLASPASAHDALTGSAPADGSTVEAPPAAVDLTFGEPPLGIGAEVRVTGPDGTVVNDGDLTITDTTVSQPLVAELPAGEFGVAWRVTSSDGHPISGELTFTATAGTAPAAPAPAPAGTATTTGPTAEPSEPTEPSQSADPTGPGSEATAVDPPEVTPGAGAADPADPGADDAGSSGP